MEKERLALNYALMLEMIKAKDYESQQIIALFEEGNEEILESFGEGIPTWKTMIEFYQTNKAKCERALMDGYEISFLTKGALKSLLSIKFAMKEDKDFVDTGEGLDRVKMSGENLKALSEMISKNWTIVLLEENKEQDTHLLRIELTYKPVFTF
ncbi:hypothetical protein [Neobacillus soli]|uniref:hypothetical protein n=1 Tax=Neobacillus soli TaxID=220688 RepID=UPI0008254340|nr:hypothetical protein [Neobacillus soli]